MPDLPPLKLKHETIIASTNTTFQNKLVEVLYEDTNRIICSLSAISNSVGEQMINKMLELYQATVKMISNQNLLRSYAYLF